MNINLSHPPASLWRRLGAIIYDAFIIYSLWVVITALFMFITQSKQAIDTNNHIYHFLLLSIWFGYFALSWKYSGQTIGMRAWRIKLLSLNNQAISWRMCLTRFIYAVPALLFAGIGLFYSLIDRNHLALHDKITGTYPAKYKN